MEMNKIKVIKVKGHDDQNNEPDRNQPGGLAFLLSG
jgi:hypothetical protein